MGHSAAGEFWRGTWNQWNQQEFRGYDFQGQKETLLVEYLDGLLLASLRRSGEVLSRPPPPALPPPCPAGERLARRFFSFLLSFFRKRAKAGLSGGRFLVHSLPLKSSTFQLFGQHGLYVCQRLTSPGLGVLRGKILFSHPSCPKPIAISPRFGAGFLERTV